MKRLIIRKPADFTPENLSLEQAQGIADVFAQYAIMPGTVEHNGYDIIDGLVGDNFDPAALEQLSLPFEILGYWHWDLQTTLQTLQEMDMDALYPHLPEIVEYDDEGNAIRSVPAIPHVPHNWSGWPSIT